MDVGYWFVFLSAAVLLTLSPGPDLIYILSRTITQGKKIGFASSLGVCSGALFHVVAAALGLSAILATSAMAFTVVKYVGAAYLIYLGYKALRSAGESFDTESSGQKEVSFWDAFKQGVLIDVLNPKVAVFFMAFLPQFVRPNEGSVTVQLIVLGVIVIVVGLTIEFLFVLLADKATRFLRSSRRFCAWLDKVLGAVFVGLGVRLALMEKP
ncbi:LysE family translocator [Enterovibrio sp. Hal110]